jgi:uncharacterized protein DUF5996
MAASWPDLPLEPWQATCDTLHGHVQVLGKLATALAPAEPELQHGALRLTQRGWETLPLPAPDGRGAVGIALDLHSHMAVVEASAGARQQIPLRPDRSVGAVARDVLAAVRELAGEVAFNPRPQEVPWTTPLDEDEEHATYDAGHVAAYLDAATRAGLVLAELRAPYRGRKTPVNAWWGSFDLAVSLFSGRPAAPPSDDFIMRNSMDAQEVAVGWWPGDARYPKPAFYAYVHPAETAFETVDLSPGRWDAGLGEHILDWDDVIAAPDPHGLALGFARAAVSHACSVCDWDPALAASAGGTPPPVS